MEDLFFKVLGGVVLFILTVVQLNTRQVIQRGRDDLAEYKIHVAENYIHEKTFNRRFDDMSFKLDKIFELLEKKADKG